MVNKIISNEPESNHAGLASYGIISGYQGPNIFKVTINHQELICHLAKEINPPLSHPLLVGDQVILNHQSEIQACLSRKNQLVRFKVDNTRNGLHQKEAHIIAVNIDLAVIVATAAEPKFFPSLVDRYLLLCQYGNIQPLICFHKCDLTDARPPILSWYQETLGIEVIETSIKTNRGLAALKNQLSGKVSVLVGASGVGKSSIINQLLNKTLKTQILSSKTKKGRHTTTSSSLYPLEEGYIIDTPGVRSLNMGSIKRSELQNYFPEFETLAQYCKYSDCMHVHEPECGVKAALENHALKMRYQTYLRLSESLQQ
jgi:ribosome biogenesis GTPase